VESDYDSLIKVPFTTETQRGTEIKQETFCASNAQAEPAEAAAYYTKLKFHILKYKGVSLVTIKCHAVSFNVTPSTSPKDHNHHATQK